MIKQTALQNGVAAVRYVTVARVGTPGERVEAIYRQVVGALTSPISQEEQKSYTYTPPLQDRIIFKGTEEEAREFFSQVVNLEQGPTMVYTDGLPIILPTEERVREMMTGTSHKADEMIVHQHARPVYQIDATLAVKPKGWVVEFQPMGYTATVERVAANAVMAGCKPEYFPVVLAIAESGVYTRTTTFWSMWQVVSGPIAKEIGMNAGIGAFDPGNQANATIGRAMELMALNLGGAVTGVNRMTSIGSPLNSGGAILAEKSDALPPGWKGLNEEAGFTKKDSVVLCAYTPRGIVGNQFAPSSYRALQNKGTGGMAERMGVVGKPGPHNWLQYLLPGIYADTFNSCTFIMVPQMAMDLYKYGFKTKDQVYEWWWKNSFVPLREFKKHGWYDFRAKGGMAIEPTSGKRYKDLPDDYMVPLSGDKPGDNMIIVAGGKDEVALEILGETMRDNIIHIDPWR